MVSQLRQQKAQAAKEKKLDKLYFMKFKNFVHQELPKMKRQDKRKYL